jgi:DNA polymerase (family 10)
MENVDVARIFDEVADLLEILGENQFRVRAYRTGARTVETLGEPLAQIARSGGLKALCELPGIAKDLAGKIVEIVSTGDLPLRQELCEKLPETLVEMMHVTAVGPKRARLFYEKLGLRTVDALEQAARERRLRSVRGIGETLEARILRGCQEHKARKGRIRLDEADARAMPLVRFMRQVPEVEEAEIAGSLRRRRDTVADLDILVASRDPKAVAKRLERYPEVERVAARGQTKCVVVLRSGTQVDVRIVEPSSFGAALHYFTGSKAHNIAVRLLGVKRHLKINEYGVFRGARRIGGRDEESVFRAVGLPWIPPELREARGEIDIAREGRLPRLVELGDIKGDLHMHTKATDGKNTLAEMAGACAARGYEYMAVTDHTRALAMTKGFDRAGFTKQAREIAAAQREIPAITILRGAEVDILEDGTLDLDDRTLEELDFVLVSIHSRFDMPEAKMTQRVLRAMRHPCVHVLAHPTARLIGQREPIAIDIPKILHAARDLGILLEIDAQPERLDLTDLHVKMARDLGVKLVVDSDAHRMSELDFMRYGVGQARRGWCTASDVANTQTLARFKELLRARRGAHTRHAAG